MKKVEMILKHLKRANTALLVTKLNADLIKSTIPADLSNEIRLELDNLKESLYLIDRDICAWLPRGSRYETPFNDDPAPWEI